MFYGVEESTDMRCPQTKIVKFTSESGLKKWMQARQGTFTYDDPEVAKNYHKTFRKGYDYQGRIKKADVEKLVKSTPTYPRCYEDGLSLFLHLNAKEVGCV